MVKLASVCVMLQQTGIDDRVQDVGDDLPVYAMPVYRNITHTLADLAISGAA